MPTDMHQLPREEFIERNLGLVHACAGRFKGRGIEYEELYAAGCLGLVKACDGFDTGRGVCFSTYAVPVILGEIKKLFRDGGTVKVSRSLKELSLKINAERERCLKRTGQEPGVTELAETLGTTPEQIALAIRAALPKPERPERTDRPKKEGFKPRENRNNHDRGDAPQAPLNDFEEKMKEFLKQSNDKMATLNKRANKR